MSSHNHVTDKTKCCHEEITTASTVVADQRFCFTAIVIESCIFQLLNILSSLRKTDKMLGKSHCGKVIKYSANLAFYHFSSTHSMKHELSCKIIYLLLGFNAGYVSFNSDISTNLLSCMG